MRLAGLFLANHIEVHDALLFVHGGYPEWWYVPTTPSDQLLHVGAVVELEAREQTAEHHVAVTVERSDDADVLATGTITFRRGEASDFVAGAPLHVPLHLAVAVRFERVGGHAVAVRHHDELLGTARFGVRVRETSASAGYWSARS
jgi:hypothetical protein